MEKSEIIRQIGALVAQQEDAIHHHPAKTEAVYIECRDAFFRARQATSQPEWAEVLSLTVHEVNLIHHYMLTSSFISAWYYLAGDKARRDKAAHSCSIVIASLGLDGETVM